MVSEVDNTGKYHTTDKDGTVWEWKAYTVKGLPKHIFNEIREHIAGCGYNEETDVVITLKKVTEVKNDAKS